MPPSRVDANQSQIVAGLRAAGYLVSVESAHRGHRYDLLVCRDARMWLLEVKRRGEKCTANEAEFALCGWPVAVVMTLEEALEVCRC